MKRELIALAAHLFSVIVNAVSKAVAKKHKTPAEARADAEAVRKDIGEFDDELKEG